MFPAPISPQTPLQRTRSLRQYYDHETQDTMTALQVFCRLGSRYRNVKAIIELQPQLISHPTPNGGDTALHFAVAAHDLETTRLLLKIHPTAANIQSKKSGNFGSQVTPLHVAIMANVSFGIINALVEASPRSIKIRDGNGKTPHELATQYYHNGNVQAVIACLTAQKTSTRKRTRRKTVITAHAA